LLTGLHVAEEVCSTVAPRQVVLTIPERLRIHARFAPVDAAYADNSLTAVDEADQPQELTYVAMDTFEASF
jgi:hypothetical protein